jgi:glutathione S-transferase
MHTWGAIVAAAGVPGLMRRYDVRSGSRRLKRQHGGNMSELIFYTHPQSRGRIVHWMLEELGEPYRTVWLEYGGSMKSADYLAVNPMGKVPALRDGAVVVTEAAAICAYLADRFPAKGLAPPPGSAARAPYYRWLFFTAGPLEMATTAKALGWAVPEGRSSMVGFGSYAAAIDALEAALKPGPHVCGEQFTAADVMLGSALGWGMMFGTIDKRAGFAAYVARLQQRDAAQRANAINEQRVAQQAAVASAGSVR